MYLTVVVRDTKDREYAIDVEVLDKDPNGFDVITATVKIGKGKSADWVELTTDELFNHITEQQIVDAIVDSNELDMNWEL